MKTETRIKVRNQLTGRQKWQIVLIVFFTIISLALGFLIAYFGNGLSFIETGLVSAIITLFGFGLTSTVFVYQSFKDKETDDTKKVIHALAKTLLLTLILIITSLICDFLATVVLSCPALLIIKSLKNAVLIYALICQIDILLSFITIIKK